MSMKSKWFMLAVALAIGIVVMLLPRPEGTRFKVSGERVQMLIPLLESSFIIETGGGDAISADAGGSNARDAGAGSAGGNTLHLTARNPGEPDGSAAHIRSKIKEAGLEDIEVDYVDGLSPRAKRFLAVLAVLIFLFIAEPIPLEITAIGIGVSLAALGIADVKTAWAPYMHPVVVFIMCCLIFAICLEKAGLTRRLGYFIIRKAGTSISRFTFIIAIGLGMMSMFVHDAAACAIGIVTMLPMMRAVGIQPHTNTARFMMLSLPFACSCGGMGTLVGGGRNMVAAAFLKEFTGIELTFFDWMLYCLPAAVLTVPAAVFIVYLVYRPDPTLKLPDFDEEAGPWTALEKKTLAILGVIFLLWLTKGVHNIDYSVTGMLGVAALILAGALTWEDIQENMEWGTALFIFGGGISLGLAMGYSGAAAYFANLFFPLIQGGGWLLLFVGVGVFGALVTNAMANVAAAALILPIVIPMAQLEGVDPTVLALCLGTATSFALLLVIGCPPNAIAYSYRFFKSSDLTRVGALATPALLAILILVAGVWWSILGLV